MSTPMPKYQEIIDNPEKALDKAFKHYKEKYLDCVFMWVSHEENGIRYGHFTNVRRSDLVNRKFEITVSDYRISIHFLDGKNLN